jgi:alpha,alpha-trehalase
MAFYDFNTTSGARNARWTTATFYPLWNGIVPAEVLNGTKSAFGMFATLHMVMTRYNGTLPVTFTVSGQQW